uniref:Uncharacterized protein n=1 Tax=Nicotiana tabacum TaxID=4097 RepID=A0A1S3XS84_TOBAC
MLVLPFPQKQRREKLDRQFGHFLEVLNQVHVNLPFTEILLQIPAYAKFLKEILSNKRKAEETLVVKLTEHCSVVLQNKLPRKCGDTGSFTIPCSPGCTNLKNLCVIQVDKFAFHMDFIVMNMEENKEVPLILGRPFLATGRAILDIQERQLMLRVGEERVVFKMKEAIGAPREESVVYSDFKVDVLKELAEEDKHDKCG